MKRTPRIVLGTLAFGVTVALVIARFSGSPQLGLHASFWVTVVFGLWLEARVRA